MAVRHLRHFFIIAMLFSAATFADGKTKKSVCETAPGTLAGAQVDPLEAKLISTMRWYGATNEEIANYSGTTERTISRWSSQLKNFADENKISDAIAGRAFLLIEKRLHAHTKSEIDDEDVSRLTTSFLEKMLTRGNPEDEAPQSVSSFDRYENLDEEERGGGFFKVRGTGDFYEAIKTIKQIYGGLPSPRELPIEDLKIAATLVVQKTAANVNIPVMAKRLGLDEGRLREWQDLRGALFFDEAGKPREMWKSDEGLLDFAELLFRGKVYTVYLWVAKRGVRGTKALNWPYYEWQLSAEPILETRGLIDMLSPAQFIEDFQGDAGAVKLAEKVGLRLTDPKTIQKVLLPVVKPKLTTEELFGLQWAHIGSASKKRQDNYVPPSVVNNFLAEKLEGRMGTDAFGTIKKFRTDNGAVLLAQELGYAGLSRTQAEKILEPLIQSAIKGTWLDPLFNQSAKTFAREIEMRDEHGAFKPEWIGDEAQLRFAEQYYKGVPQTAWNWAWRRGIQKELNWTSFPSVLNVPMIRALQERVKKSPAEFIQTYKTVEGARKLGQELGFNSGAVNRAPSLLSSLVGSVLTPEQIRELDWGLRRKASNRGQALPGSKL